MTFCIPCSCSKGCGGALSCTRCLNLHEYQSKGLMSKHGVSVQQFQVATTAEAAGKAAKELGKCAMCVCSSFSKLGTASHCVCVYVCVCGGGVEFLSELLVSASTWCPLGSYSRSDSWRKLTTQSWIQLDSELRVPIDGTTWFLPRLPPCRGFATLSG